MQASGSLRRATPHPDRGRSPSAAAPTGRDAPHVLLRHRPLHAVFVSTVDTTCSYLSPNHAIACPSKFDGSFPSFVSENLRRARRECPAFGGRDEGAAGRWEGTPHGLRGHLQLSAP